MEYAKALLMPDLNGFENELQCSSLEWPCVKRWKFRVSTKHAKLMYVSFLCPKTSTNTHFKMLDINGKALDQKVQNGVHFKKAPGVFEVNVKFRCTQPGVYKEVVCFDFTGQAPYIVKPIFVFVGNKRNPLFEIERFRYEATADELDWNLSIAETVMSDWLSYDREPVARQLLSRWKPLGVALENDTFALQTRSIGPDNYKKVMHGLIRLEEAAVSGAMSRVYIDWPTLLVQSTSLGYIGIMSLGAAVDPRTKLGSLTLKNSCRMLLAFDNLEYGQQNPRRVYEADIVLKTKSSYESNMLDTSVHLHLSRRCIEEQGLQHGQEVRLYRARFQISRIPFAEWHDSVERVSCWNILFPSQNVQLLPKLNWQYVNIDKNIVDPGLFKNVHQTEVVKAILADQSQAPTTAPIFIQGAFGTGKTFTFAQAIKSLLFDAMTNPNIRIILCTMSNSAADLYFTRYFIPFCVKLQKQAARLPRILRIYKGRDPSTVDPNIARSFTRLQPSSSKQGCQEFATPTTGDVNMAQLLVSNLAGLTELGRLSLPRNCFSHIFLDEAAQCFEADALKALCLAGPQTKVIMAGDPRQMPGGQIQCDLIKRYNFDHALIDRLASTYAKDYQLLGDMGYGHVMTTNYRCHPEIMTFIKEMFYSDIPQMINEYFCEYMDYFPFRFYNIDAVGGHEEFHQPSSTYCNSMEAIEIQYRVTELLRNWRPEFDDHDLNGQIKTPQSQVAVICPYDAQVMLVKQRLMEKELTQGVNVSHIQWVQGMEFRAIFISTVRTLKGNAVNDYTSFDLAFLNDKRLLNTAITRAKSVVCIVGSASSLTSVGNCKDIWYHLIDKCKREGTFYETGSAMPTQQMTNGNNSVKQLEKQYENLTVVPSMAEQRLMQDLKKNSPQPIKALTPSKTAVSEQENQEIARQHSLFYNCITYHFEKSRDLPRVWDRSTDSGLVWLHILGATQYANNSKHSENVINKIECEAVGRLVEAMIESNNKNEVLIIAATAGQAADISKVCSNQRVTCVNAKHPLPMQSNYDYVVISLTKSVIKSESAMENEKTAGNRNSRAKNCLNEVFIDMEHVAKVFSKASKGIAIVGNYFNASVSPAWDWLFRTIQQRNSAFTSVGDLQLH